MGSVGRTTAACVLVVEDEPVISSAIARQLQPMFAAHVGTTVAEATELMAANTSYVGAIVDVGLPDGSGMSVLEAFRERYPDAPAVVLTGHTAPETINAAHRNGAHFVCKLDYLENVAVFAKHVAAAESARVADRERIVAFAQSHTLTGRETQILALAVSGCPRSELAHELGVSENTIKSHVRTLLRKCDAMSLAEIPRQVGRAT